MANLPILVEPTVFTRILGEKEYEMKDHLGNVRVVISDLKVAPSGGRGPWAADILSWNNYYPFGMVQPDRHGNTEKYRYGFNGKEMDNEVKENPTTGTVGTGNHYDYGARGYDPRSGRWWSVDPLFKKYPSMSAYIGMGSNPISIIDVDGRDIFIALGGLALGGDDDYGETTTKIVTTIRSEVAEKFQCKSCPKTTGPDGFAKEYDFNSKLVAASVLDGESKRKVKEFILANYSPGEKIILYGYSWGAETLIELVNEMAEDKQFKGIKIDLLITVDASKGQLSRFPIFGADREIPDNVITNVNFYQEYKSKVGSQGDVNKLVKGNVTTKIINTKMPQIDLDGNNKFNEFDKKNQHTVIDEFYFNENINWVREAMGFPIKKSPTVPLPSKDELDN